MIQLYLGKVQLVDPATDLLGRSQIGWDEGMSAQQVYDIARWAWAMSAARAEKERYAVVCAHKIARQAIEIHRFFPSGERWARGERLAFEGRILGPGDPVHDHYVDKPAPNGPQQGITYFTSPLDIQEHGQ